MKLIKSVNLIENKKAVIWINIISIPLFVLFLILFSIVAIFLGDYLILGMNLLEFIIYVVVVFGLITLHELIHGLFFKIFHSEGKVEFGFKKGLAYARSPQSFYSKLQFAWISLAPFVVLTLGLFLLFILNIISAFTFVFLTSLHAASCGGDFYYIYLLIRAPRHTLVEDTKQGINLYKKE